MGVSRYEGTCDVCGAPISLEFDDRDGIIDIGIREEGGVYTWIRHYATAPPGANPDCARYSSEVDLVSLPAPAPQTSA
jgi:hypothetical protein